MTKKRWLIIEPYVHINKKMNYTLMYNSLNYENIIIENSKEFITLINKIVDRKNLRVVEINKNNLKNSRIKDLLNEIEKKFIGQLIFNEHSKEKPCQLPLKPFLISDVKKMDASKIKENFIYFAKLNKCQNYIDDVFIYINNYQDNNSNIDYYKQFPSFIYSNKYLELSSEDVKIILEQLKNTSVKYIHILGGNIFMHSKIKEILNLLKQYDFETIFHLNFINNINKTYLNYISSLSIHILPNAINKDFITKYNELEKTNKNINFNFIIENDKDYYSALEIINKFKVKNHSFAPLYTKSNLIFFIKHLFMNENNIISMKLNMQEIYTNQKINTNYFGKITILNNGEIYTNVNLKSSGNIKYKKIIEIIHEEFIQIISWRKTRQHQSPCKSCVYCDMCPPVSNYDYALKRYDLCKLSKSVQPKYL